MFKWLLISWSPDSASVRNKMLYASTKATLKKEFGGGQVKEDLYGNMRVRTTKSILDSILKINLKFRRTLVCKDTKNTASRQPRQDR